MKEQGTNTMMHRYYHNFSANKQNHDAQTQEQGGSAENETHMLDFCKLVS
jgi:hypothetical protein